MRLSPAGLRLPSALAVVALSGALLSLSLPPVDAGPLAFLALVPFLWMLRGVRPRRGALLGLAFGGAFFGATLYWILLFGELAWGGLVLGSAAFLALFGALAPAVWREERPVASAFGLAALWTAVEWFRSVFPFDGFTWGQLGTTQAGNPFLVKLASWTGVWGLSFAVALLNALILVALEAGWGRGAPGSRKAGKLRRIAIALSLAVVVAFGPSLIVLPAADGRPVDVAALQVDVRAARGLPPLEEDRAVARMNADLNRRLASGTRPDLVVWGESALDPGASQPSTWEEVTGSIAQVGAATIVGSVRPGPTGQYQNQGLVFDGSGRIVDTYAKVHLVPFGEYVPFRGLLGWISALRQIPYDEVPGDRVHTVVAPGLPPIGVAICFENTFPSIDRELVRQGASFLVVITNNASYEQTAASRQHMLMSRLRAVETGRWVVHAAVSGISAFVAPDGRVLDATGLFEPAIIRHTIRTSGRRTIYVRLGDWVPLVSLLLAFGLVLLPRRGRRTRAAPEPLPTGSRTLVILPTYNERDTIEWVLERLLALAEHVDVLVVDDSSPDGTGRLVEAIAEREERVRLVERRSKSGLASAYLVGFRTALEEGYDLAVEMDSDLSHEPEELPSLLEAARGHDMVIGSRYVPGGSVSDWSRARVALSKGGNLYARLCLGFPLRDATSGFRVYRRGLLEGLAAEPTHADGYGFQIELALRAWRRGYDVAETPITFREREHGHSKISRRIVIEALWKVALWGLRARLRPSG